MATYKLKATSAFQHSAGKAKTGDVLATFQTDMTTGEVSALLRQLNRAEIVTEKTKQTPGKFTTTSEPKTTRKK